MTKEELLQSTDVFLLDLDGTVYLDETPIGQMCETLVSLRKMGKRLVYLTNNSSKTQAEYREKLTRIGLYGEGDLIYTSGMATVAYLNEHHAGKKVSLLGTDALKADFAEAGIPLTERDPDVCVLAYDTQLTFAKLKAFNAHLAHGAVYIATHPDDVCPTKDVPMPDVGSYIALLACSSGRRPDVIIGKPARYMGEYLAELCGVTLERMCMVGDRLHTDIRFGNNCGMHSLLVLSGETTRETMSRYPDRPELILEDLNSILLS